jgi:haloalkane dehalogenase
VEALGRLHADLGLGPVVLFTHDWGVLIGLRWACDNPDAIAGLVISGGGFFADRRWHDMANVMRTEGQGEQAMEGITRELLGDMLAPQSRGISDEALDEYWKGFADDERRRSHLELYRSGDFEKLEPYEGRLAQLGVPTLIVWGAQDRYASVRMAHRFHDEIPDSEIAVLHDAGHFVWEDEPERCSEAVRGFLHRIQGSA